MKDISDVCAPVSEEYARQPDAISGGEETEVFHDSSVDFPDKEK